ncbi:MAG: hypothetical protein KKA67_11430 [Spirochaetes bacterium]|nr:hypothetical protein [Spirochaetota bacterium]MBU1081181.1 hypothetical protein [Spirochaetota bacterium]
MAKRLVLALAAIALLSFSSCQLIDSLFYNADQVSATELEPFSGTPASSQAEAKTAVIAGLESGAVPVAEFSVSGPSGDVIARAFPRLLPAYSEPAPAAASRALPTTGLTVNSDGSMDYSWTGSGYALSSNPAVSLSGSMGYSMSANAVASTAENILAAAMDVSVSLNADLQATVGAYSPAGLKGAVMNLKAKGDSTLTGSLSAGYRAKGYAAVSMNAGFSLDETASHKGGKYVVSLKFAESYDATLSLADVAGSAAGEVTVNVLVKVYDASNRKLGEYTFTAADFAAAAF